MISVRLRSRLRELSARIEARKAVDLFLPFEQWPWPTQVHHKALASDVADFVEDGSSLYEAYLALELPAFDIGTLKPEYRRFYPERLQELYAIQIGQLT